MDRFRMVFAIILLLFGSLTGLAEDSRTGRISNDWLLNPGTNRHSGGGRTGGKADDSEPSQNKNPITERLWSENARIYTSTGSIIKTTTYTPVSLGVYTKFGSTVGSFEHQITHQTDTFFDLVAVDVPDDQELWDSGGRATLVESYLICRVSHKGTISDASKKGLTLGMIGHGLPGVVTVDATTGVNWEFRESSSEEEMKRCPIGPIPKYTKEEDIKSLCRKCEGQVLSTLKKDIESRMKNYGFLIKAPVCQGDDECRITSFPWDYWHVGRCVLAKDKNANYISDCRIRSRIGGACAGKTSSGMFEYKCDKGLECRFIKEGKHFWTWGAYDYDKYECRDPNRPHLTRPDQ